jgi:glycosyltransferase involved in cell wall biosynthesis
VRDGAPRVLMTTEGTYPYAVGGVSSWCDVLVRGLPHFRWQVLPIVAGGRRRPQLFELPANATVVPPIDLWSQELPTGRPRLRRHRASDEWPRALARSLLSWSEPEDDALLRTLVACRGRPEAVRRSFRSPRGWRSFLAVLEELRRELAEEAGHPPAIDALDAARLYQALYWVARTAAVETPPVDVLHVTAAGWSAIPALVDKALHGTPLLLTEHGVYLREAYLNSARSGASPGARFAATRLARGLARAAYAHADVVAPVTDANARWEEGLGVDRTTIRVVYNGVEPPSTTVSSPRTGTVVSVGRIDPLKDVHTMLRVAKEVVERIPEVRFLHYGPAPAGDTYADSCRLLHERLGLGERFRFMGKTDDPGAAFRSADVVLMTSISEGLPLAVLEAMSEARPVVATAVGGVPDVVRGCGLLAPPGDAHGLAAGVVALLRNPGLASHLGARGAERVRRRFARGACVASYAQLLSGLAGSAA